MKILLTGAFGFLGSHLLDSLLKTDHEIFVYDDFTNPCWDYYIKIKNNKKIHILPSLVSVKYYHYDVVYHLGAMGSAPKSIDYFQESWESNVKMSFKLLMDKNYDHFIYASSSSVYGDQNGQVVNPELTSPYPKSPYATWKFHVEQMIKLMCKSYQIFRLFNIYGPRQSVTQWKYAPIVPKLCTNKKTITIYNNGESIRSFTYVSDVIDLFVKCIEIKENGIYNVCSVPNKVKKLVEIVNPADLIYTPNRRDVDIDKSIGDISKTKRTFNWEPKIELLEGLTKTMEYYAS